MKKLLLLSLLLPGVIKAQDLELSVKGGRLGNNIKEGYWGKCAALSGTVGLGSLRLGISASSYSYTYRDYYYNGRTGYDYSLKANPFLVEALLLNRFGSETFSIDFGIAGGIPLNNDISSKGITYTRQGAVYESKVTHSGAWITGGFVVVLQYSIAKRFAAGVELQAKKLAYQGGSYTLYPITAIVSVRL